MHENYNEQRLGEILVNCQLISQDALKKALDLQVQSGGKLGSILVELGYLTLDDLLEYLGKQFSVPTADLFQLNIEPDVLNVLPFEKMKSLQVLPVAMGSKNLFLAMVDPNNVAVISDLEFTLGKTIQPIVIPAAQMSVALNFIEKRGGRLEKTLRCGDLRKETEPLPVHPRQFEMKELFCRLVAEKASDLLLSAGVPPCLKKNNELVRLHSPPLTPGEVKNHALSLMTEEQKNKFPDADEFDFAYTLPDLGRFRINIFKQRNSVSISARHIIETIPTTEELGLPPWVEDFVLKSQGLILITGPSGHGKSTTLAALVDVINTKRKCNIITIEDPIEYTHRHKSSNINQREVGVDTRSFAEGLRRVFRQAPDVIVIGEMRDLDSFAIALQAAETGHLVLSTLHSNTSLTTIERIIDVFPADQQHQIRVQLAESFLLVLNQRLVPLADGSGRILVCEKLINTFRTKNMIRGGKTYQIKTVFQQSAEDYQPIDVGLAKLCNDGKISFEEGIKFCDSPRYYNELVRRGKIP
jgi:twitching motility protein PilT